MNGQLVGLGGYAFSGKDTVADILQRDHGWGHTFMSKPLMQALLILDPLIPDGSMGHVRYSNLHGRVGYDKSKENPEVRRLLQLLGTEVGRNMFGANVWLDLMFREANELREEGVSVAVAGIRFANELDAIRANGGTLVWVERPGFSPVNTHASDNTLSAADFDTVIVNDGTLTDLARKVDDLVYALSLRTAA